MKISRVSIVALSSSKIGIFLSSWCSGAFLSSGTGRFLSSGIGRFLRSEMGVCLSSENGRV